MYKSKFQNIGISELLQYWSRRNLLLTIRVRVYSCVRLFSSLYPDTASKNPIRFQPSPLTPTTNKNTFVV